MFPAFSFWLSLDLGVIRKSSLQEQSKVLVAFSMVPPTHSDNSFNILLIMIMILIVICHLYIFEMSLGSKLEVSTFQHDQANWNYVRIKEMNGYNFFPQRLGIWSKT